MTKFNKFFRRYGLIMAAGLVLASAIFVLACALIIPASAASAETRYPILVAELKYKWYTSYYYYDKYNTLRLTSSRYYEYIREGVYTNRYGYNDQGVYVEDYGVNCYVYVHDMVSNVSNIDAVNGNNEIAKLIIKDINNYVPDDSTPVTLVLHQSLFLGTGYAGSSAPIITSENLVIDFNGNEMYGDLKLSPRNYYVTNQGMIYTNAKCRLMNSNPQKSTSCIRNWRYNANIDLASSSVASLTLQVDENVNISTGANIFIGGNNQLILNGGHISSGIVFGSGPYVVEPGSSVTETVYPKLIINDVATGFTGVKHEYTSSNYKIGIVVGYNGSGYIIAAEENGVKIDDLIVVPENIGNRLVVNKNDDGTIESIVLYGQSATRQAIFVAQDTVVDEQTVLGGSFATAPEFDAGDDYTFAGWMVGGEVVDVAAYPIDNDTLFIAKLTKKPVPVTHQVYFVYQNEVVDTQTVADNGHATAPTFTQDEDYTFDGWTINGAVVDLATTDITADTLIIAKVTKIPDPEPEPEPVTYVVCFVYQDKVVDTQSITANGHATAPDLTTVADEDYIFGGWLVGNEVKDLSTYAINANTIFIAKLTKKPEPEPEPSETPNEENPDNNNESNTDNTPNQDDKDKDKNQIQLWIPIVPALAA